MNLWICLAASLVSCPWAQPVPECYCECVTVYLPCAPVYAPVAAPAPALAQTPAPPTPAAVESAVENVVDQTTEGDKPVAELAVAEEEEDDGLEPAGFFSSGFTLGNLALDWGVATIGAGTLYPTNNAIGLGSGGFFPGNPGSSSGQTPLTANTPILTDPPCDCHIPPPNDGGDPSPIPEPVSGSIWGVAIALASFNLLRRRVNRNRQEMTKID